MQASSSSSAEIIKSLKSKDRSEEEKFRSMTYALNWLHQQLVCELFIFSFQIL